MEKIDYVKLFEEVKLSSDESFHKIKTTFDHTPDSTIKILLYYDAAIKNIVTNIFILSQNESNYYSTCILYRSLIEHFFKAYLIFTSGINNVSKYTELFYEYGKNEYFGYYLDIIDVLTPELKEKIIIELKEKNINKNQKSSLFFKWRNIIKELSDIDIAIYNSPETYRIFDEDYKLNQIIVYSRLSSFVHGGIDAISTEYDNQESVIKLPKIYKESLSYFIVNRLNIFILFNQNGVEEFNEIFGSLRKIFENCNKES